MSDDRRQVALEIEIVEEVAMLGTEGLRDLPRKGSLVAARLAEAKRERLDGPVHDSPQQRHRRGGVDAAAEEYAERHVCHSPRADRSSPLSGRPAGSGRP